MKTLIINVLSILFGILNVNASTIDPPPLHPEVILANYTETYTKTINNTVEYVFLYQQTNYTDGARINVESNATRDEPLMVVVRQKKGILFWQVPLLVERTNSDPQLYNKTSRTLCSASLYRSMFHHENNSTASEDEYITLSISSGSKSSVSFEVTVFKQQDFYISPGERRNVTISPSEPQYFGYNFTDQGSSGSVLIKIESDTDTCMTLSIQNSTCPVFDLEMTIPYSTGYWQTVSQLGGITIPREAFPDGFFIVLAVKGDDTRCTGSMGSLYRKKYVTLSIKKNITTADGYKAALIVITIVLAFCSFYVIGVISNNARIRRKILRDDVVISDEPEMPEQLQTPTIIEEPGPSQRNSIEDDSSLDEDDIDMLDDIKYDKEIYRTKRVLAVSDLARKDPKILHHKSRLYLYYLITIAVFYALPVVQLVYTYQRVLQETGNQDSCYYNFLCSHPFFGFSDFNHVFSNFAYVLLGLLFILLTYVREQNDLHFTEMKKSFGIPQHYGLFYAMGVALMMEGLLSASYHVCPNHSNFQFDTSFMYIISVLCMVKIYQTRHPDINARASVTFGILALIILLGMVGVLDGSNTFWIIFTIFHVIVCLFLTAQIYYMGRWRFDRGTYRRIMVTYTHDARASIGSILRPMYIGRFLLLLIAIFCNIALAVVGNVYHARHQEKDFATFLLAILMFNLLLYMFFYIVMKICHREKILLQPLCYIILSFIIWGFALHFFINKSVSWALTPAQSRFYNTPCKVLNFFDNHDIWHFLSALAMFFSFMVLLTLDDDLEDTHRSQIPVF
ncbi:SID1 transmembrane family member 1-like [Aphidius gifuensis]|nr:SID1 transmembrane family member 1-like [Aphidius gifuensis]